MKNISYAELLERQITAATPTVTERIEQLDGELSILLELQRTRAALRRADINGRRKA